MKTFTVTMSDEDLEFLLGQLELDAGISPEEMLRRSIAYQTIRFIPHELESVVVTAVDA